MPRSLRSPGRPLLGCCAVLAFVALVLLVRGGQADAPSASGASVAGDAAAATADSHLSGGYDHSQKPDPIKTNGPVFVDWPKPDALLVLTGEQMGYLEPCGCAGLTNQFGGLKRRHTFLKQLAADGWPLVVLDGGGQIKRYGQQAQIKFRRSIEALSKLGYHGVGFGASDLRMEVLGVAINLDPAENPLTSANIGLLGFDPDLSRRWRTAQAGSVKIGFTTVLSDKQAANVGANPDLTIEKAADALRKATPELEAADCDHLVLMVYGSSEDARELAKEFPAYRWVVSTLGADEPPLRVEKIEGTESHLIEVGHKGMYAVAVGLYASQSAGSVEKADTKGAPVKLASGGEFRYQKIPLDHRYDDSPDMQQMLVEYQQELKTLGMDGLGVKPQLHPANGTNGSKFVGSQACADCHDDAYQKWLKTPHSHATQTLVELDPPRHFDPECLSCHVTGWDAQKYHPYLNGYQSLEQSPHLLGNGCENCHGPGGDHVAAENGDIEADDARLAELQAAMRMTIGENEGNKHGQVFEDGSVVKSCVACHDADNSPDFDFQKYWPKVAHGPDDE